MVAFLNVLAMGLFNTVDAHAGLMDPPPWMDRGGQFYPKGPVMNTCAPLDKTMYPAQYAIGTGTSMGLNCYWFQNHTFVPNSVNLEITGDSEFATYGNLWGYDRLATERFPWSAPGHAPIDSPCGMDGGNPRGCWTGNGYAVNDPIYKLIHGSDNTEVNSKVYCGGGSYDTPTTNGIFHDARTFPFLDIQTTEVKAGGTLRTAWGIIANHGGGYAFRLCKLGEGMSRADVTEECFRNTHLEFRDDELSEVKKLDQTELVIPVKTFRGVDGRPWRRNPIPACGGPDLSSYTWTGGAGQHVKGCPTWFPPPAQAPELYGFGYGDGDGYQEVLKWYVVDRMVIPENLEAGDYVLSFRYDSEQGSQVWSACSNIKVVEGEPDDWVPQTVSPPAPPLEPSSPKPYDLNCKKDEHGQVRFGYCSSQCCSDSHACGYCGNCVGLGEYEKCPGDPRNLDDDETNDLLCGGCQEWCWWCMRASDCYKEPDSPGPPPVPKAWDWNCKRDDAGFVITANVCASVCCHISHACGHCGACIGIDDDEAPVPGDPRNANGEVGVTCGACRQWCNYCMTDSGCYHDPPLVPPTSDFGLTNYGAMPPSPTPEPMPTSEPMPTPEPAPVPAPEPTPEPTPEPSAGLRPELILEPTLEPTSEPTMEPTLEPMRQPTPEPSAGLRPEPIREPTPEPILPTLEPTPGKRLRSFSRR